MKGPIIASGVPEGDLLVLEFRHHSQELYETHKSLFLCWLCKNLCYCNKSGRYNMLGLHAYLLACLAPGGVRCMEPSECLLGILSLASSRRRAVCNAKPTSAPVSRASSAPTPHVGQPKIADLFGLQVKGAELSLVDDNSYSAPNDTQFLLLVQTQQQQQSEVRGKSSGKCPHVEAGLLSPIMGTESQSPSPPSAESIADERDRDVLSCALAVNAMNNAM
ncbi:hypothetical protein BC830DRAFT_1175579 [Chytriomyces sp. MP71]|nr:hypothetical protein BC830DRAFT_1175579 [Chytriomyces sp. MP71]